MCKLKTSWKKKILLFILFYFLLDSKSIENTDVYSFNKSTRESHDHMMLEPLSTNDPEVSYQATT